MKEINFNNSAETAADAVVNFEMLAQALRMRLEGETNYLTQTIEGKSDTDIRAEIEVARQEMKVALATHRRFHPRDNSPKVHYFGFEDEEG